MRSLHSMKIITSFTPPTVIKKSKMENGVEKPKHKQPYISREWMEIKKPPNAVS